MEAVITPSPGTSLSGEREYAKYWAIPKEDSFSPINDLQSQYFLEDFSKDDKRRSLSFEQRTENRK